MLARQPESRYFRTTVTERILMDPNVRPHKGWTTEQAARHVMQTYSEDLASAQQLYSAMQRPPYRDQEAHARAIVEWAQGFKMQALYQPDPLKDTADYLVAAHRLKANVRAIHESIKETMTDIGEESPPGWV